MKPSSFAVLDLQRLATDKSNDVTDVLRKALLVATKLEADAFRTWIEQELQGYSSESVPQYRKVRAELKVRNPFHGWCPVLVEDPDLAGMLCQVELRDPIGSFCALLQSPSSGDTAFCASFSPRELATLVELQSDFAMFPPTRVIGRNQIATIVDVVRTSILQWSINLEKEGVLGEGLQFTELEKETASTSSNVTIQNFQGIWGNVAGSVVTQDLKMMVTKHDVESLRRVLQDRNVSCADIDDLETALKEDPTPTNPEVFGNKVSSWIGKMMSKAASGAWQIGVSAAGNLLASIIRAYYGL